MIDVLSSIRLPLRHDNRPHGVCRALDAAHLQHGIEAAVLASVDG